ncbi:unnamed protein product, partial [Heterotrigona itama]
NVYFSKSLFPFSVLIAEGVPFQVSNGQWREERYIPEMDKLVYGPNTTSSNTHLFDFEKNFVPQHAQVWMEDHFPYCFLYCTLYVILIFGGKYYMSNRPKFNLRRELAIWNAGLALFSITTMCRTMPAMFHLMRHHGLYYSICSSGFSNQDPTFGYWGYLFALSKLVEFGDTFFIILRKQPLIFLHWYHHIVTFLYTWFSYVENAGYAKWFAFMNVECLVTPLNISVAAMMYVSYAILFARFFAQAYLSNKSAENIKNKNGNSKPKVT